MTILAISAWLTGRKPAGIVQGIVRAFRPSQWSPANVALVVFAVAIGGVSSNLLAAMIAELGWSNTFARYPFKAGIYVALVLTSAVVTTLVVVR